MPTLFSTRVVTEAELGHGIVREFDGGWFPEYHSGSVEDDDGAVYVYYFGTPLTWSRKVGQPAPANPDGTAVHLEPRWESVSRDLVARVTAWLGERYGFRERP